MIYSRQGWHGDRFLLGTKLLGAKDETVNIDPACADLAQGIRRYKSLGTWTSLSDTLFAAGGEARGFALLTAFTAPLLPLLGRGGVSVCLHTNSPQQARMLFAGIQSVYARQQTFQIGRSMPFSRKLAMQEATGSLPCIYPEVFSVDPSSAREFIEASLKADGVLLGAAQGWLPRQVSYRMAGDDEERCVLEIPLPEPTDHDAELLSVYHNNFGYAGAEYVRYLVDNVSYFRQTAHIYREQIGQKLGGRKDERLLLNCISLVALAAAVCGKLGLLHVTPDRMVAEGGRLLEIMRARDYEVVHLPEKMLEDYLLDNLDAVLAVDGGVKSAKRDYVLYDGIAPTTVRYERLTHRLYISREHFNTWCKTRMQSGHAFIRQLLKSGVGTKREIMRGLRSSHPHVHLRPNPRQACFEVDPEHPLISSAVRRLERALKFGRGNVEARRQELQQGVDAPQTPAPSPATPPESG